MGRTWIVGLVAIVAACGRVGSTVQPTPDPSAKPLPTASAKPPTKPPPEDVVRIHGDIEGKISLRSRSVVVGEPIMAVVEVRSTKGPLKVFVGGDQRNAAGYPTRLAMRVLDAGGAVVCDTVDKPVLPNFGGIGSEQSVPEKETWIEGAVLNPMCPALATPGDYRVTLHRRIAPGGMITKPPGATVPTSCDYYPVHEGPIPKGYGPPACVPQMDALPWVTSEIALHVDPFDTARMRVATESRLRESAIPPSPPPWASTDSGRWRIDTYVCSWLSCACPKATGGDGHTDAEILAALPSSLPKSFPDPCP